MSTNMTSGAAAEAIMEVVKKMKVENEEAAEERTIRRNMRQYKQQAKGPHPNTSLFILKPHRNRIGDLANLRHKTCLVECWLPWVAPGVPVQATRSGKALMAEERERAAEIYAPEKYTWDWEEKAMNGGILPVPVEERLRRVLSK